MENSNVDKKWLKEAHLFLMNLITKNRWDLYQRQTFSSQRATLEYKDK